MAGMKVATQTPPMRSGRRVVFLTVDDGTGPADATFFEDAQDPYADTVFHDWLLLVRGQVRRTGRRGVSIRATGAWDLQPDPPGVAPAGAPPRWASCSGSRPVPHPPRLPAGSGGAAPPDAGPLVRVRHQRLCRCPARRDEDPSSPPSKLWHASPGSSGW